MPKPKQIQENVPLAPLTTMKVGGPADFVVAVKSRAEVEEACNWALDEQRRVFVLGEGSNIVVSEDALKLVVIKVEVPGFKLVEDTADTVTVEIGAGEHWDDVVRRSVAMKLSGIEAMSMIPGTLGGAPVQNAGAFGQEIADTFVELEAFDLKTRKFVRLNREQCDFHYRDTIFKREAAGRYVITTVTLRLSKHAPKAPTYDRLVRELAAREITKPTVADIRAAVMSMRAKSLPDPSVVPNSGSFFENPIVEESKVRELEEKYDKVPSYPYEGKFKLSAGWLLEQCGYKGAERHGFKMHDRHALVITNPNHAGYNDLMKLVKEIQADVKAKFGIELEPEPLFVK